MVYSNLKSIFIVIIFYCNATAFLHQQFNNLEKKGNNMLDFLAKITSVRVSKGRKKLGW